MRAWLVGADRRRAMAEVGLVVFALTLPLAAVLRPALVLLYAHVPEAGSRWPVLGLGMVYAGLLGALLGALRLGRPSRGPAGGNWRQIRHELAGAAGLVLAIWAGALLAHVAGAVWVAASSAGGSPERLAFALWSPVLAGVSTVAGGVAYVLFRGAVLVWPVWDRLRRARLLWALTHAQLVAGLLLVAVVAALLTTTDYLAGVRGPPFGPENLPADAGAAAVLVAWVATRLLPAATALLVLGVAAAIVVLPPVALISFLVLRRTTQRLGGLVGAAEALRTGHLAARVPVGGEDEVARLQVTFNAMAADLERTLRDLQDERDRVAGLLEARRQLVAGVSHELRTPVATVRGYLESALRRDGAVPADLRVDLETVEREVGRLQRLIEDLFTLARAEVGRLELRPAPTDLGAVVRRLVDTTAPLAWRRRRVQVIAEVVADLPPAHADAQRLEQIVSNLLGNAVRHTPPGGLVAAAVAAEPDAVRVEIRDTGEGIAPEDLPRVFERFYRGRNGDGRADDGASPGAGLGLALTKELAEAMGGSVEAASTPGEGSRFTVRLPRA